MVTDMVIAQVSWLSILSIVLTVVSVVASLVVGILPFVLG
jgi:hypothetical protein